MKTTTEQVRTILMAFLICTAGAGISAFMIWGFWPAALTVFGLLAFALVPNA